ncbi:lyase [Lithospermum erythrorhizon]|uniref:Lyase n=1 Tax=Lithospermum erythrorhizon TaxID=34254 RepID=A0AAV3QF91_LITER
MEAKSGIAKNITKVAGKLELMEPVSSVKDRIAYSMIKDAEEKGLISPGKSTLIEITSGNTGIGLASIAASNGLQTYHRAEMLIFEATKGLEYILQQTKELHERTPDSHFIRQFENLANPKALYI